MLIEAYDVGGTQIRSALYEGDHKNRKHHFTVRETTEQDFCAQIQRISEQFREETPDCVSILLPGPVKKGKLLKSPPLGIHAPIYIKKELGDLAATIIVENDINGAVYGEIYEGFGKRFRNFYLLTISTGIGAGIVIDGKPVGRQSGEFGHIVVERESPPFKNHWLLECGCGNKGCWNSICSGQGLENVIKKMFQSPMTCEEFFEQARKKSDATWYVLEKILDYNAQGIGTMLNACDVEAIIVMGSIGRKQFDSIIPTRPMIRKYTINPVPPIIPTLLGDDIGLIGAYHLAVQAQSRKQQ